MSNLSNNNFTDLQALELAQLVVACAVICWQSFMALFWLMARVQAAPASRWYARLRNGQASKEYPGPALEKVAARRR